MTNDKTLAASRRPRLDLHFSIHDLVRKHKIGVPILVVSPIPSMLLSISTYVADVPVAGVFTFYDA
jgi:hypothetical protein